MSTEDELVSLLMEALSDSRRRSELIGKFQRKVWDSEFGSVDRRIAETFRDLAYDLDFCEADTGFEECDPESEIKSALDKLAELGLSG